MRIVRAIVLLWINSLPFFQLLAQEYNTERFKIAAATNESLKRQMGLVEDRNRQLDRISAQHEASFTALREELLENRQRQSKAELEADRLRLENSHLTALQVAITSD